MFSELPSTPPELCSSCSSVRLDQLVTVRDKPGTFTINIKNPADSINHCSLCRLLFSDRTWQASRSFDTLPWKRLPNNAVTLEITPQWSDAKIEVVGGDWRHEGSALVFAVPGMYYQELWIRLLVLSELMLIANN